MNLRRQAVLVVVCAILSNVLMPRGLAGRLGAEGLLLGDPLSWVSPDIDEGMVEQMWLNCSLDLMDFDEFSLLWDIISDSDEISRRTRLLSEGSIQEAMALMSPEIKHNFLDCLSKQNFPFHKSGEDRLRSSFAELLGSLLGWHPVSRRHLVDETIQTMASAFPAAPVTAPSPATAPAIAPSHASAPSPIPSIYPPSYAPSPSLVPAPASAPAPNGLFVDPAPSSLYLIEYPELSPVGSPVLTPKKQKISKSLLIVAVLVTASVASLLATCVAYFYFRYHDNKNNSGRKDDKPFLNISPTLSDFSGSSQKPFGQGNLINNDKLGTLPFNNDPSQDIKLVETSSEPSNTPSNVPTPKIPPPPGMPPLQKAALSAPVPPPPPSLKPGLQPPPPPKDGIPPRPPQANSRVNQPLSLGAKKSENAVSSQEDGADIEANAPKTKLKPFFWDKVQANNDQSMVWDQIKAGSFQFNEELIESLFGYNAADKTKSEGKRDLSSTYPQYVQILDPKKSQNLAIFLKALNVKTEEIFDALMEGNELPVELLQTLLRMTPSTDEELKLRLYSGDHSLLGPAEQFLKALVDIPFAFQRMDALLFMGSLEEEVSSVKESFSNLEVACKELRSSRLFLKLLEAVLKTGNRMNDGTFRGGAQAFKLDTLLKLSDVKGIDGKTTLLHFVVQEIIRSEGVRAARLARDAVSIYSLDSDDFAEDSPADSGEYFCSLGLKVVSGLSNELENVKKAASLDADALSATLASLGHRLVKAKEFLNTSMRSIEEESGFHQSLESFVEYAEADITSLLEEEKRIRSSVKSTIDYFHGNAGRDEGFHLFVIVRDFLGMVDKVCKEVGELSKKTTKMPKGKAAPTMSAARDPRHLLFPAIRDGRTECSSSDDESP